MGLGCGWRTRLLSSSLSPQSPELLVGGDSVTQQWSQGLLCAKYYPGIGNLAVNRDSFCFCPLELTVQETDVNPPTDYQLTAISVTEEMLAGVGHWEENGESYLSSLPEFET